MKPKVQAPFRQYLKEPTGQFTLRSQKQVTEHSYAPVSMRGKVGKPA